MSDSAPVEALQEQLTRERRQLEIVQDIALALGSILDLDELLARIAENVTELMDAERSTIYIVDPVTSDLWSRVAQGEAEVEIRLPMGTGIAGWVAQKGEVLSIADAYADSRFDSTWDAATGYLTRSILCAPMVTKSGQVIGVIQVLNKRKGGSFTADDEIFVQAIASQAAITLHNARLVRSLLDKNEELHQTKVELEQRNQELDLLLDLEQLSNSARDLDQLLARVITRSSERCDAAAGAIVLVNSSTETLKLDASFAARGQELTRFSMPWGEGPAGWVIQKGQPLRVADTAQDPRCAKAEGCTLPAGYQTRSVLCVPLRGHHGILGAIELLDTQGREAFTEGDEKVLTLISGQVAQAIELARTRERRDREERLATIGHLLSGVLHDLKTPMTVISGYVQLMVQADDAKLRQSYADTVLKQFQYIGSMTAEILAFARGESNILLRRVYLHQFIEEIGELLRKELEPRGIDVVFELNYRGTARFDEGKMRRVFYNIARNAAEAMPDGGTFSISISRDEKNVIIGLSDTGTGVPEEVRNRMFQSFATAGKKGGTGLGLAVVKKIIDEHGGHITFSSEPNKGTTFTITLPLAKE
jgi:signal transduction histidine kinase